MIEVDSSKEPAEGEVLILTIAGGILVKGAMLDVAKRLAAEQWPTFTLAESGDTVILNVAQVVALRGGTNKPRPTIGFHPR